MCSYKNEMPAGAACEEEKGGEGMFPSACLRRAGFG